LETAALKLRVSPKAAQDAIAGWHGGALKIKVRAAPEKGRANASVVDLLAGALGVPKAAIVIESGQGSRDKRVRVHGLSAETITARLCLGDVPFKSQTR
jgi:uncharacterized protein (TIGR00251 family)